MIIGIISDSHDHMDNLRKAVAILNERKVEAVLHAGDYVAPFTVNELSKLQASLHGIYGNNDGERLGLQARLSQIGKVQVQPLFIELGGKKIAIAHEPEPVEAFAASKLYDVVIYGHTHKIDIRSEPSLIINPGEVCGWLTGEASLVILNLQTLEPELVKI